MVHPDKLDVPDRSFRLTDAQRERIRPGYDRGLVEEIFQHLKPDTHAKTLSYFDGSAWKGRAGGYVAEFGDPDLDVLLEAAAAPMWEDLSVDELRQEVARGGRPGMATSLQRRLERR